jgi:hypothetical protein
MRISIISALLLGALTAAQDTVYDEYGNIIEDATLENYGGERIGDQTGYFEDYYAQMDGDDVNA